MVCKQSASAVDFPAGKLRAASSFMFFQKTLKLCPVSTGATFSSPFLTRHNWSRHRPYIDKLFPLLSSAFVCFCLSSPRQSSLHLSDMSPSLSNHKDDGPCIFFRAERRKQGAPTPNASQAEDKEQGQLSFVNTVTHNSEIKQKAANIKPTVDTMFCSWETLGYETHRQEIRHQGSCTAQVQRYWRRKLHFLSPSAPTAAWNATKHLKARMNLRQKLPKHPSLSQHSFRKHCGVPRGKCAGKFPSMQCWKKPQTCMQRDS